MEKKQGTAGGGDKTGDKVDQSRRGKNEGF